MKFFEYTNIYTGINPPRAEDDGLMELFKTAVWGRGPGCPAILSVATRFVRARQMPGQQ